MADTITITGKNMEVESLSKNHVEFIGENLQASDGYHTFDDLYLHRVALWIALCGTLNGFSCEDVWRSRLHSDGSSIEGWFLLGVNKMKGAQMTYHIPDSEWDACDFAETLDLAPEWDGHTSADVLERLKRL